MELYTIQFKSISLRSHLPGSCSKIQDIAVTRDKCLFLNLQEENLEMALFSQWNMRIWSSLVFACMYYFGHTKHPHTADNSTGVQPPIQYKDTAPSCTTMELDACFPLVQMQGPHVRSGQLGSDRAWLGSIGEGDTHASRRTVQVMCMYEPVHSDVCTSSETK